MENTKNTPLVTVLLPCFNAMPYLPEALESIINQTYTNLEILCINDGSTDGTKRVLEGFAKKDNRVRVVQNDGNLKLIATLNKGIDLAKGEYIARMDADDICSTQRIELQLEKCLEENLAMVGSNVIELYSNGITSSRVLRSRYQNEIYFGSYFYSPFVHPSIFAKTEILKHNKYSTKERALHTEDYELWTRIINAGHRCENIKLNLLTLRVNDQSVSHRYEDIQIANFIKCAKYHQEKLLKKPIDAKHVEVVVNRFSVINYSNYKTGINLMLEIIEALKNKSINVSKSIVRQQQLDILIQARKKSRSQFDRFRFNARLLNLIVKNYTKKEFRKYLRTKFQQKNRPSRAGS